MPYTEKLPPFVLATLFKNTLVLTGKNSTTNAQFNEKKRFAEIKNAGKKDLTIPGKNFKNILIIVKEINDDLMPERRKNVLLKMLTACKLTQDNVAIFNMGKQIVSLEELKPAFLPEKVLLFDITTKEIGLPFIIPNYQVQQFDGCIYVCAPGIVLDENEGDENIKAAKTKLWASLKRIFLDN